MSYLSYDTFRKPTHGSEAISLYYSPTHRSEATRLHITEATCLHITEATRLHIYYSPTHRSEAIIPYYVVASISSLLTIIRLLCKTLNAQTHTPNAQTHTPDAQTHSNTKILLF